MLDYLFVYGTLRKAKNGGLHPYLINRAAFIDYASTPGKLFLIDSYPGAIKTAVDCDCRVRGEIYRLFNPQDLLPVLDRYEECTSDFPKPHEYRRQPTTVILDNTKPLSAWVYWFQRPVKTFRQVRSGDYFDYLPSNHKPDRTNFNPCHAEFASTDDNQAP